MKILNYHYRCMFLLLTFYFIFIANFSQAQPGTLDLSYGRQGMVTTGIISETSYGVALQSNGKIVVGGYNSVNGDNINTEFGLSRFNQDGTIDTTFGYRGVVHTTFPGTFAKGYDIVIQPDEKIILAGQNYSEYALARYNTDGSTDSTFGFNGLVSVDIGGHPDEVRSVLLQPDGKILVSGQSRINLMRDFSIARFESNGSFDLSFGNQGKVIVSLAPIGDEYGEGMALQPDGKIIMAGTCINGSVEDFVVSRFNIDGSLDTTFGNGGIKLVHISNTPDYCKSVVLQSDGKIVLGGYTQYDIDSTEVSLARLLDDGSMDSSFGVAGISHPVHTGYDYVTKIKLDASERILVTGNKTIRCLNNGSLDLSYGTSGIVYPSNASIQDLAVLPDSSVIVVGNRNYPGNSNVFLAKMDSSGLSDLNFGLNGSTVFDYGIPFHMYGYDMTILNDDKTVMMGHFSHSSGAEGVVFARYDSIGRLDLTFGNEGVSKTVTSALMYAFKRQNDGKFIAGGKSVLYNYGLMKFDSDGSLDSTFGVNGSVENPSLPLSASTQGITSLVLQNDEKIVVTGYCPAGIGTVRYLPDGNLDPSFSGDGIVIDNFSGTNSEAYDLKIQQDGKIIVTGKFLSPSNYALGVLRYNTDGTPDNSFGVNGKVEITHPDGIVANDIFIQPDHKILITGSTLLFNNNEILLLRLNENGSLDSTFGAGGMIFTSLTNFNDNGAVLLLQSDGKIVAGVNTINGIQLIRYNGDGTIDTGFGLNGVGSVTLNVSNACNSIAFQSDGKIMVGGGASTVSYFFFFLARFDSSGFATSLNELQTISTNHLFPNPSVGEFNLLNSWSATVNIEIYSTDGKLIFEKRKHPSSQTIKTNLPSGIYIAKIIDGKRVYTQRVVVGRN